MTNSIPSEVTVRLYPVRVCAALGTVAALLTVAHIVAMVGLYNNALPFSDWRYVVFFDLDRESSFGTWFSVMLLLLAGQMLLFCFEFLGDSLHVLGNVRAGNRVAQQRTHHCRPVRNLGRRNRRWCRRWGRRRGGLSRLLILSPHAG